MNILKKMTLLESLTSTEKTLVDYIVKQPHELIELTSKELSEKAYVSLSTAYRLINKLGLNGMNEFKIEVVQAIKEQNNQTSFINVDYPMVPEDNQIAILNNLKEVYGTTITETMDLSNPPLLTEVAEMICKKRKVDVYTSAGNIFFAQNFQFQMQEIGYTVNVPIDEYMQQLTASNSDATHVAVMISFGGRGAIMKKIGTILQRNQVPIVLITSPEKNPLHQLSHLHIYLSSLENHYKKISSFSTRMSLLYVLDTLYSIVFHKNYEENLAFKLKNYQKMNEALK